MRGPTSPTVPEEVCCADAGEQGPGARLLRLSESHLWPQEAFPCWQYWLDGDKCLWYSITGQRLKFYPNCWGLVNQNKGFWYEKYSVPRVKGEFSLTSNCTAVTLLGKCGEHKVSVNDTSPKENWLLVRIGKGRNG